MIIRVVKHSVGYTIVDNFAVDDARLSAKALGIFLKLVRQPNHFKVSAEWLSSVFADGRDSIRSGLRELEQHGYMARRRVQKPDGTWGWEHDLYERPDLVPAEDGKAEDGKAVVGSGGQNTDDGKTDVGKTDDGKAVFIRGVITNKQEEGAPLPPAKPAPTLEQIEDTLFGTVGDKTAESHNTEIYPKKKISVDTNRSEAKIAQVKSKASSKRPQQGNPNHALLVGFFCEQWSAKYAGKYPFAHGKDDALIRDVLTALDNDFERAKRVVQNYLRNTDKFYTGHPLSLMRSQLPRFMAGTARPKQTGGVTRWEE